MQPEETTAAGQRTCDRPFATTVRYFELTCTLEPEYVYVRGARARARARVGGGCIARVRASVRCAQTVLNS